MVNLNKIDDGIDVDWLTIKMERVLLELHYNIETVINVVNIKIIGDS